MKYSTRRWIALVITLAGVMAMGACKKKTVAAPPPPPPPPPAPSATLSANPNTIQQGQSSTLSWRTDNATQISIEGIGSVEPNGSQSVTPKDSTTYRLLAKGPGGAQEATARVTVTPPPAAARPQPSATEEQLFAQNVHDIFFDYDRFDVRPDQSATLQADAQFLQQHPNLRFTVEGYCDERGSTEYNLALGDSRAAAVKQALVQAGISTDRILTRSYGKEKPFCTESNELCWQQNRRGHFVYHK